VAFSTIRRETLETRVYEALRKAIIEGRLARDERLVQDDLATQFGTSRIPVRDALKRLETEGLVTLDERGGYVVSYFSLTEPIHFVEKEFHILNDINPLTQQHADIRQGVRDVCRAFDSAYWQKVEEASGYPEAFVQALTEAGWLSALIPEEFGGGGVSLTEASVILEEINRSDVHDGNPVATWLA